MSELDGALSALLSATCAGLGVELYDLEQRSGTLLVTVEREGGIDLDEVARIASALSAVLDEHEDVAPAGHYELEVSTPGLERRLRRPSHFATQIGQQVAFRLAAGSEGERRFEGRLVSCDEEGLEVEVGSGTRRIAYEAIERAHTVFDWKAALAAPRGDGGAKSAERTPLRAGSSPKRDEIKERA